MLRRIADWLIVALGYLQNARPLRRNAVALPVDRSLWPSVDVLIPTYNEPLAVVRPTVLAALGLDWPQEKLRVWLLDDGRREELRAFASACGKNASEIGSDASPINCIVKIAVKRRFCGSIRDHFRGELLRQCNQSAIAYGNGTY
jgi:cellulose synthase/poly-beta-1,6-N-acetylglucosamine synthase-like glycosyltransferase